MTTPSESPKPAQRRPIPQDQTTPIQVVLDVCLFLILFVTPWLISTQLKEVFNTTKNCWVGLMATIAVMAWLANCILRREVRVPRGKVVVLATALIAWGGITIAWSIFWRLSLVEYSYQAAMFAIFLVTYCNVYNRERIENLLHFSIAAGVITAGYALIQYFGFDTAIFTKLTAFLQALMPDSWDYAVDLRFLILPPKPDEATKIYSFMGHRNYLAGFLIAVIPIALSRLYAAINTLVEERERLVKDLRHMVANGPDWDRALATLSVLRGPAVYAISIVMMLVTVVQTHTRGSWVGLSGALLFFFVVLFAKFPRYAGLRRSGVVLGCVLILIALLAPLRLGIGDWSIRNPFNREPRSLAQRIMESTRMVGTSAHQRLLIYRTAIFIILDSPQHFLFGTGFGTFGLHYMPYQRLVLRNDPPHSFLQRIVDRAFEIVFFHGHRGTEHWVMEINKSIYAHNEILHFWSEIGLVGILLMLALLYHVFKDAYRFLKSTAANDEALLFLGMMASICAVLGHNLFTFDLHLSYTSALFWFLIAATQRYVDREDWVFRWGLHRQESVELAGNRFALGLEELPNGALAASAELVAHSDPPPTPGDWQFVLRDAAGHQSTRPLAKAGPVWLRRPQEPGAWTLKLAGPAGASHETVVDFEPANPISKPLLLGALVVAAFLVCQAVVSQALLENAWRDAFLKFRQHQFEESFLDFKRALKFDPNRGEVLFDYGRGLMDSNRNSLGIQTFQRATLSFVDPANYHNIALCYYKENDLANAEKAYRQALDLNVIYEQSLANLAFLLMDKAARKAGEGKKAESEALNKEAETLLERGFRYYPRNSQFSSTLGAIRAQQGKLEGAREYFEKALKYDPKQCKVWINYGTVLYNLKRYEKAVEAMREARKWCKGQESDDMLQAKLINVLKGYYHERLKDRAQDPTVVTSYGKDLFDCGLYAEAQEVFRKLRDTVAPGDPTATFYLAECYLKLGYREQARVEFQRLQTVLPAGSAMATTVTSRLADLAMERSEPLAVPLTDASLPLLPLPLALTPK